MAGRRLKIFSLPEEGNRREAQREGKYNGRANGSSLSDVQLVEKHSDITRGLHRGETIRRTAKLTGRAKSTGQRLKKAVKRNYTVGPGIAA